MATAGFSRTTCIWSFEFVTVNCVPCSLTNASARLSLRICFAIDLEKFQIQCCEQPGTTEFLCNFDPHFLCNLWKVLRWRWWRDDGFRHRFRVVQAMLTRVSLQDAKPCRFRCWSSLAHRHLRESWRGWPPLKTCRCVYMSRSSVWKRRARAGLERGMKKKANYIPATSSRAPSTTYLAFESAGTLIRSRQTRANFKTGPAGF